MTTIAEVNGFTLWVIAKYGRGHRRKWARDVLAKKGRRKRRQACRRFLRAELRRAMQGLTTNHGYTEARMCAAAYKEKTDA